MSEQNTLNQRIDAYLNRASQMTTGARLAELSRVRYFAESEGASVPAWIERDIRVLEEMEARLQPDDETFVLAPTSYEEARKRMREDREFARRLHDLNLLGAAIDGGEHSPELRAKWRADAKELFGEDAAHGQAS